MRVELKKIELENFKQHAKLVIDFSDVTTISGRNGVGKTTIADAWVFIRTGRSFNDEALEIKPIINDEVQHHLNYGATATILVDGVEMKISRCIKESYTRKSGETESIFKGNTTVLKINDIEVTATNFEIELALLPIDIFKLITIPHHLERMKWEDRRAILKHISGIDNGLTLLSTYEAEAQIFLKQLIESNRYQQERKALVMQSNLLKKQEVVLSAEIEALTDQVNNFDLSEREAVNEQLSSIKEQEKQLKDEINLLHKSKSDANLLTQQAQDSNNALLSKKVSLNGKISQIKADFQNKEIAFSQLENQRVANLSQAKKELANVNEINSNADTVRGRNQAENDIAIEKLTAKIESLKERSKDLTSRKVAIGEELINMREQKQNNIESLSCECDKCGQSLPDGDFKSQMESKALEHFTNLFNQKRADGNFLQQEITAISTDVERLNLEVEKLKMIVFEIEIIDTKNIESKIATLSTESKFEEVLNQTEIDSIQNEIDSIVIVDTFNADDVFSDINGEISKLNDQVESLNDITRSLLIDLGKFEVITVITRTLEAKKVELKAVFTDKVCKEKHIYLISKFVNEYFSMVQSSVNNLFDKVSFQMFTKTNDGVINEACVMMFSGVPITSASTGERISAGVEVSNVISKFNDISTPIFVDCTESLTAEIITSNQLIKLEVSDSELTIN